MRKARLSSLTSSEELDDQRKERRERRKRQAQERARKLKRKAIIGTTALALFGAAWIGTEPVAKFWAEGSVVKPDEPERTSKEPEEPVEPEEVEAVRDPVEVGVAVDHTRSAIAKELPNVRKAIVDFIKSAGGILQQGDTIVICEFDENAECWRFKFPDESDEAIARVNSIEKCPKHKPGTRTEFNTHVAVSVYDVLTFINQDLDSMVAVWSDSVEEGPERGFETDKRGEFTEDVLPVSSPVTLIAPREKFLKNARTVAKHLKENGGEEVNVALAKTGDDFRKLLNDFTSTLQELAQEKADQEAAKKHAKALEEYQNKLTEYQEELRRIEAEYQKALESYEDELSEVNEEIEQNIESIKTSIQTFLAIIAALMAMGLATIVHIQNRPKLRGSLEDRSGRFAKSIPLPRKKSKHKCRISRQNFVLKATRKGVMLLDEEGGNRLLKEDDEIAPGIFYTTIAAKRRRKRRNRNKDSKKS